MIQTLTVSCGTCGEQTMSDTKKCDNCREVETRLAQYLFDGGTAARTFVWAELVKAEEKAEEGDLSSIKETADRIDGKVPQGFTSDDETR